MLKRIHTGGCVAALATLSATVGTAPAAASVGITSFTLSPSSAQAGAAPNLSTAVTLSPSTGDDPQSITVALAPGLLANPTVPATCTQSQLQANQCPSGSQIGTGTVSAKETLLGLSFNAPAKVYMVTPQSGQAGAVGMVASTPLGTVVTQGPVTVRTAPTVGANLTFQNLPRQVGGINIAVTGVQMTMSGTIGGRPFTRNPTSCALATSTLSVSPYSAPATSTSASSSFTPSGCASLPYAPVLSAGAAVSGTDGATEFTTTITQQPGEAASSATTLTLPSGLLPRSGYQTRECATPSLSNCPSSSVVGSATAVSPLSARALTGQVLLVAGSNPATPGIAIVFPSPFAITLTGTTSLSASGTQTSLTGMPDVPLSSVQVTLTGGSNSLLVGGYSLCGGTSTASGAFAGQNGASAASKSTVTVTGCA
jgi:hypothetical protein